MKNIYDIIIIGGGIIGSATGYFLSREGLKVLLLERGFLSSGSTGRCITGIRQQFSTSTTIRTAMESVRLFRSMNEELGLDVEWKNSGYLFLGYSKEMVSQFKKNIQIQKQFGLDVEYVSREECRRIVPLLNIDELIGGAWCPSDGQANPFLVVKGFCQGIVRNGGSILINQEVNHIQVDHEKIKFVKTTDGNTYYSTKILNAAGPWAKEVGKLLHIDLPVKPERHEALITEGVEYMGIPMLVDYRLDGGYFVQRKNGQFIGCYTPETSVEGRNTDSTFQFMFEMARRMCRLVPALQNISILRQWAGSYSMTTDGNPIIGETEISGFYCSVGMCGHGFMLGPAIGKFLAQYITEGTWPFPIDEFIYGRKFGEREKMA